MKDKRFYQQASKLLRRLYSQYQEEYQHQKLYSIFCVSGIEPIPKVKIKELKLDDEQAFKLQSFAEANPCLRLYPELKNEKFYFYEYVGLESQRRNLYEPFIPTWTMTAWLMCNLAKEYGCKEIVDIGSGYGSYQYCGKLLGLEGSGIEVDRNLFEIQKKISDKTKVNFCSFLADAEKFDYSKLEYKKPAFVLIYKDRFTEKVLSRMMKTPEIFEKAMFIFYSPFPVDESEWDIHIELELPRYKNSSMIHTLATKK